MLFGIIAKKNVKTLDMNLRISYICIIFVYFYVMSKHSKKYLQILETSRDLFWRFGIRRVTVEEICEKSAVSKMTFYKYFSNKNDLVKEIIDNIYAEAIKKYRNIMDSEVPYKEKVTRLAMLKLESTNEISHEFLDDFYSLRDDELSRFLHEKVNENLNLMREDFIKAIKAGDIRHDIKPEFLMYLLNHLIEMGKDPSLNSIYPDAQEMIMELMNFFFYGILPRDDNK